MNGNLCLIISQEMEMSTQSLDGRVQKKILYQTDH